MKRLLSYDPLTGTEEWFYHDSMTGESRVETKNQDLSPTLDWTAARRNDPDYWKAGVKNDRAHYAHIPSEILLKWHTEGVDIGNPKALIEMVNRPEWAYLKTTNKVHIARG